MTPTSFGLCCPSKLLIIDIVRSYEQKISYNFSWWIPLDVDCLQNSPKRNILFVDGYSSTREHSNSSVSRFKYRPVFLGNKALTAKLLRQGYRYFKLRKAFSKSYRRHSALLEKYRVSLKTLLQQGISEREFYGYLVYRFRKIVGKSNFSEQFRKLINRYKRIGYSLDIMRQSMPSCQPNHC